MRKINVLGTDYEIQFKSIREDVKLNECDAYCDYTVKKIVIENPKEDVLLLEDIKYNQERLLRHELLHAFLYECGLCNQSEWATNEEMIDFFAIQSPKIIGMFLNVHAMFELEVKNEKD